MKNIFLISGVGVYDQYNKTILEFLKINSETWEFFDNFLNENKLTELNKYCILTFGIQICISEIWENWGIKPDIIVGHSLGEISACVLSGLINLFDALDLIIDISNEVDKHTGWLCHGYDLKLTNNTFLSSINFKENGKTHMTVCGLDESFDDFVNKNESAKKMHVNNPWHHNIYKNKEIGYEIIKNQGNLKVELYLPSKGGLIKKLEINHWNDWLCKNCDMIKTINILKKNYKDEKFNIIELGAHPVMEQMVSTLNTNKYVASFNRSVDPFEFILHNRKKICTDNFKDLVKNECIQFDSNIKFGESLLLQNYNSLKLTQLADKVHKFFPNLGPQDLYKYQSINNLIENFGFLTNYKSVNLKNNFNEDPIVIIGASCILPYDIYSMKNLWEKLLDGHDGIRTINELDNLPCGFIDDIYFDHNKFNISKKEAESMDPQQIISLILADMLVKDSNLKKEDLWGTKTGVYIGAWNTDFEGNKKSAYYAVGKNNSIISARISSHYNLLGPSKVINTACSSSLECIYDAFKDLQSGRVDYAIAGGVNMLLSKEFTHAMKRSTFLGNSGRCKTFDNNADGYVRSEGGGLILITRKSKVKEYYAEIIGGSTNHNGFSPLITVPSSEAQSRLILDSCSEASITTDMIDYFECHGTGTKIGDPIEVNGLKDIINKNRKTTCYLGSIKSNIGHLESGAGIAGIIKSILILINQKIPKNIHVKKINENLNLHNKMKIVTENIKDNINIIGVSSFGFGGSNGHILLKKSNLAKKILDINMENKGILINRKSNNILSESKTKNHVKVDKNNLEYKNFVKLNKELGIEKYDIPIIDQNIDSLTLTELVIQIENIFSFEITINDIIENNLSCNNIFDLIFPSEREIVKDNIVIENDYYIENDISEKESVSNDKLKDVLIDLGIDNLNYFKPLIDNKIDSLTLTEFIIQIEEKFNKQLTIKNIIEQKLSINDIFGQSKVIRKPKVTKQCKVEKSSDKYNDDNFNFYNYTKVKDPNFKIKTTHVGSLPKIKNNTILNMIEKQLEIGIDFVNDGELSRKSYVAEIMESLTGFEDNKCIGPIPKDIKECSSCSRRFISKASLITLNPKIKTNNPACTGPIKYKNLLNLQYNIKNYLTSLEINGVKPENSFYTVPSPGTISIFFKNLYYDSDEEYLSALSKALKKEYEEITRNGINLQIDCPDLAMGRHTKYQHLSEREFLQVLKKHIFYLNKAIENINPEKLRVHICWGNYSGPHNFDINFESIVKEILNLNVKKILLESANHSHNCNIDIFKKVKLPKDKTLVLGVIDTGSQHIESPELIAKRLIEASKIVGKDQIEACTDCGFSTTSEWAGVESEIAWQKIRNMVKGADMATKCLSDRKLFSKRGVFRVFEFSEKSLIDYNENIEIRSVPTNFNIDIFIKHLKNYVDIPILFIFDSKNKDKVLDLVERIKFTRYYPDEIIEYSDNININNFIEKYSKVDESKLIVNNEKPLDNEYDIVVIGAGITGLYSANKLINDGYKVCLLEKNDKIAGIWNTYANFTSQVNTSEGAYRIVKEQKNKINKDHTSPREIVNDVGIIRDKIKSSIYTNHEVVFVDKIKESYKIQLKCGKEIKSKGVVFAINDRVGKPREIHWKNEDKFKGKIINGYGKDVNKLELDGKNVVIVGMGAFATENLRTALEAGAKNVTILCRRIGTVCPKYIDYINFVNKDGNSNNINHNSVVNTNNMIVWRKLYEKSGAKQPECWPTNIKHYGHTISVSDIFFIAYYFGLLEIVTDEIKEFNETQVITNNNGSIEADIVIKCTGFERNSSLVPKLTKYKETNSINYLDKNLMYLADALIDDNVFNSIFGSSVIEMAKFFIEVYSYFYKNPEKYEETDKMLHKVNIKNRKWSDYIKGTNTLIENNDDVKEIVKNQLNRRNKNFINAHNVEEFKKENKREWNEINKILSCYAKNHTVLEYPEW